MANKRIYQYDNGATLIYYQQNINNTTGATIGFRCGADRDGEHKGISHFLEHMLFSGTKNMSPTEVYDLIKYSGTEQNAFTTQDYIVVDFNCPNSSVDTIFKLNSNMLLKKDFTDKQADRERNVILQELMLTRDNGGPDGQYMYLIKNKNTKLGEDILGDEKSLKDIHAKDLKEYSDKYFISENLVMSVVSSLPFEDVKKLCDKYFVEKVKSNPKNKVTIVKRQYNYGRKNKLLTGDIPNANTFMLQFTFKGKQDIESNDIYSKFENFLFNGFNGKFYERMRIVEPLVYDAHFSNYQLPDLKLKSFLITTSPLNVNKVIKATMDILNEIIYEGVTDRDMMLFKTTILAERERKTNIKYHEPSTLFNNYVYGEDVFVKDFYQKVLSLSKDEVNKYLKETYHNSPLLLLMCGDFVKAMNLPTSEQINKIIDKYANMPYTMPDDVLMREEGKELLELQKQVNTMPTLIDILKQYKLEYKILYSSNNSKFYNEFNSMQIFNSMFGSKNQFTKLKKINFYDDICKKMGFENKQEKKDEVNDKNTKTKEENEENINNN